MSRTARWTRWGWAVGLWAGACGSIAPLPAPVPLEGAPADIAALSGRWSGRYWSDKKSRRGTLTFLLQTGADSARGDVHMTFSPALELYGDRGEELSRSPCTTIDITIVRVKGRTIRGDLAPYYDPDCDCRTRTVFEGELKGDSVAGTFISRRESSDTPPLTGRWFAVRE